VPITPPPQIIIFMAAPWASGVGRARSGVPPPSQEDGDDKDQGRDMEADEHDYIQNKVDGIEDSPLERRRSLVVSAEHRFVQDVHHGAVALVDRDRPEGMLRVIARLSRSE